MRACAALGMCLHRGGRRRAAEDMRPESTTRRTASTAVREGSTTSLEMTPAVAHDDGEVDEAGDHA